MIGIKNYMKHTVKEFLDNDTETFSYVISDPDSKQAAVIDPVLGFEPATGRIDMAPADVVLDYVQSHEFEVAWILETHAHADHLSGAQYLQSETGARVGIGQGIVDVQAHFKNMFMLDDLSADGSQFDRLFGENDLITLGALEMAVIAMPGHTSDSVAYRVGDSIFVGDTLFMPDVGTARCDFPGGDAAMLYRSIGKLLKLPGETRLYMCHDYPPGARGHKCVSTVAEQIEKNIHVAQSRSEQEFVKLREARDRSLKAPRLILPSLQVNIRAGHLPDPEKNGIAYLKIPLNQL